ncbi:hypothetical protein ACFPFP_32195 [Bradyrhizobium sp. GCM10023182]|uniref:Neutral/alkaline non-lysosomal ceramidase N-terminal domain-containing protein n=1 Tax=Bradyrhizobium zhengyangense TaxID=2911009 RepID=A0ABS9LX61_9BRAD|nr:hypothetical protein [Bradyrhizobium zhengyangense]MCG2671601.1 hypothetical protein [Bradyrhizobium zhengyangense]
MSKIVARVGRRDITPRDRPVRLAGHPSRTAPIADILDAIEVGAILFEGPGRRVLLLSFDLLQVGTELQDLIIGKLTKRGFGRDEIVLQATHTHSAPATDKACAPLGIPDEQYVAELGDVVDDLVRQILGQEPTQVAFEIIEGPLRHSINRRRYWPFPTIGRMHGFNLTSIAFSPNPKGPKNELATVVLMRDLRDDQPIALLWHYTCHPTAVIPTNAISADFPGKVRERLRERLGPIPCLFLTGFCGNIRPNIVPAPRAIPLRERLQQLARIAFFGNLFPSPSADDWRRWSESLASELDEIAQQPAARTFNPQQLRIGSASVPLSTFFHGKAPAKPLCVQVLGFDDALEIVAISAEPSVEWEAEIGNALPKPPGCIRLHAGYLGSLCGYLPTTAQVPEGGYEVEGFQSLFGFAGHFDAGQIGPAVLSCVQRAFEAARTSLRRAG